MKPNKLIAIALLFIYNTVHAQYTVIDTITEKLYIPHWQPSSEPLSKKTQDILKVVRQEYFILNKIIEIDSISLYVEFDIEKTESDTYYINKYETYVWHKTKLNYLLISDFSKRKDFNINKYGYYLAVSDDVFHDNKLFLIVVQPDMVYIYYFYIYDKHRHKNRFRYKDKYTHKDIRLKNIVCYY